MSANSKDKTKYFQLNKLPIRLHKAIKVCAAMDGMGMQEWVMKILEAKVKTVVKYEEGD